MNPSQIDLQFFPQARRSINRLVRNAMGSHPLEEVLGCPEAQLQQQENEKRPRPHPEKALKCPRCDSTNTKFCYYNNYSLSQPRYFCKGCGRYWTQGGSLRNVPVGGGCRRKKRSSSSSSSSSCKRPRGQTLFTNPNPFLPIILPRPSIPYDLSDPSLTIIGLHKPPPSTQLGLHDHNTFLLGNPNPNLSHITSTPTPGFLDIRRSGLLDSTNLNGFHNLYFGFGGSGNVGEVVGGGEEMVVPFEGVLSGGATTSSFPATATSSQRSCRFIDGGKNNVVVGHTPVARRWGRQLGCGSRERVLDWGGEEMVMPFEGGLGGGARTSSSAATTTASNRSCRYIDGGKNNEVVGLQWHAGGEGSLAVDQRREHWTGVGSSSWHGLINNSLM